jgi:hypothetical protein
MNISGSSTLFSSQLKYNDMRTHVSPFYGPIIRLIHIVHGSVVSIVHKTTFYKPAVPCILVNILHGAHGIKWFKRFYFFYYPAFIMYCKIKNPLNYYCLAISWNMWGKNTRDPTWETSMATAMTYTVCISLKMVLCISRNMSLNVNVIRLTMNSFVLTEVFYYSVTWINAQMEDWIKVINTIPKYNTIMLAAAAHFADCERCYIITGKVLRVSRQKLY